MMKFEKICNSPPSGMTDASGQWLVISGQWLVVSELDSVRTSH
jgi:hypothetical protein